MHKNRMRHVLTSLIKGERKEEGRDDVNVTRTSCVTSQSERHDQAITDTENHVTEAKQLRLSINMIKLDFRNIYLCIYYAYVKNNIYHIHMVVRYITLWSLNAKLINVRAIVVNDRLMRN